jgi:ABC-type branched-subunit amino acid transport system substrate-binding protein
VVPPGHSSFPAINGRAAFALRERFGPDFPIIVPDSFLANESGVAPKGTYVSGAALYNPARQLPPAGRRFVSEFSATQPGRVVNTFTPYAAQATEVLLAAIAASDGTRESIVRQLLRVRIQNGILGSFGFNRQGDMTVNVMPVFRVPAPALQDEPWPLHSVIKVPAELVG